MRFHLLATKVELLVLVLRKTGAKQWRGAEATGSSLRWRLAAIFAQSLFASQARWLFLSCAGLQIRPKLAKLPVVWISSRPACGANRGRLEMRLVFGRFP